MKIESSMPNPKVMFTIGVVLAIAGMYIGYYVL